MRSVGLTSGADWERETCAEELPVLTVSTAVTGEEPVFWAAGATWMKSEPSPSEASAMKAELDTETVQVTP